MSNLFAVLLSTGTQELITYLIDTGISIGTGKIWKEIKSRIDRKSDSIEARLYVMIEKSVLKFLYKNNDDDIFAAICEEIFFVWCREGELNIERINYALRKYSEYVKLENIYPWHQHLNVQIIRDSELFQVSIMNNVQILKYLYKSLEKNFAELTQEASNNKNKDFKEDVKHINQALAKLAISAKKGFSDEYLSFYAGDLFNMIEAFFIMEKMIDIIMDSIIGDTSSKMMYIEAYVGEENVWQSEKIAYIANKDRNIEFADIYRANSVDELLKCNVLEDFVIHIFNMTCEENSTLPIDKVSVIFVNPKTDVLRFGIEISCVDALIGKLEYAFINWDEYEGLAFKGDWMDKFRLWMQEK